jgi:transposase
MQRRTSASWPAACAIHDVGLVAGEGTFSNDPAGFERLERWLRDLGVGRVGIEGSAGYGAAAARFLVAAGQATVEVAPQLSHRERLRTRRAGKSDPGDCPGDAPRGGLPPVRLADASRELHLLVQAREDLVAEATRLRNRLHADLVVLVPGYSAARPTSWPRSTAGPQDGCSGLCAGSMPSWPGIASPGSTG